MELTPGPWEVVVRDDTLPGDRIMVEVQDSLFAGELIEARVALGSLEDYKPKIGTGGLVMFGRFGGRISPQSTWFIARTISEPDDTGGVNEFSPAAQGTPVGAQGGRGTFKATTADWASMGGPGALTLAEPAPKPSAGLPHASVHETRGGIRTRRDDSPGARCVDETIGVHARMRTDDGAEAVRATSLFELILGAAQRIAQGPSHEVVGGDRTVTVEGSAATAVDGRTFYRGAGGGRVDIGSLRVAIDAPSGAPDAESTAEIAGTELVSLGLLMLRAAAALVLEGRTAALSGLEDASLSGGDVLIEATGLESVTPIDAAAMLAAGIMERVGRARVRGNEVELAQKAESDLVKPPVVLRVRGGSVEVAQRSDVLVTEKSTMAPLLVSALGYEALQALGTLGTPAENKSAAVLIKTALDTGEIKLAEGFKTS